MKKGRIGLSVTIATMLVVSAMGADISKWTGGSNGNWTNTANWNTGLVPGGDNPTYIARFDGAGEGAIVDSAVPGTVTKLELGRGSTAGILDIQSGGSIAVDQFRIASFAGTDTGTVNINGGAVSINGGNHGIGYAGTGIVNLNTGTFQSTDDIIVGRGGVDANGTLNVLGGVLTTVDQVSVGGRYISDIATGGVGAFNLSGGTATIGTDLKIGNGGNGSLIVSGTGDLTVGRLLIDSDTGYTGVANLNGGTTSADKVSIGNNGTLTLLSVATLDTYTNMSFSANGLLVWEGDHTAEVAVNAGDGTFSWSDGLADYSDTKAFDQEFDTTSGWLRSKYDVGTGNTEVWTVIPEPATLGMVAAMGAGMLFIRRKFMM